MIVQNVSLKSLSSQVAFDTILIHITNTITPIYLDIASPPTTNSPYYS